jgi:hypothetical protein
MVALTILLIVLSGVSMFMRRQSETMVGMRAVTTRDQIANRILASASSSRALAESAKRPENRNLKTCINRSGCPGPELPMGFFLYDSFGRKLTGTRDKPQYYTVDGAPCENDTSKCPILAYTSFGVVCADSQKGSCVQPLRVKVWYTVMQDSRKKVPGIGSLAPLNNRQGNEVTIADILKPDGDLRCAGVGEFVRAIKPNGELDCAVPAASTQNGLINGTGANGSNGSNGANSPNSGGTQGAGRGTRCPNPGELLRGFDANGKPDCVNALSAIGFQKVDAMTTSFTNPNPNGGAKCGWSGSGEMRHAWGKVCCPGGKVPMGGGGSCNYDSGGFIEISRPEGKNCWLVDCCKYTRGGPNPPHSPIYVQCIYENTTP